MMRLKRLVAMAACGVLLTGCARGEAVVDSPVSGIPACTLDISDMFSKRDREIGFDEVNDMRIQLNGSSASCEASSVLVEGSKVTITDEGTYIVSGFLDNGSIVVDAEATDKIQLVLSGADITCQGSAALYVKQADKVFVTLAGGTENSLVSLGEFAAIDENNIDGAIFSKEDLTLNGSGSLRVTCESGHGIVSKDDLVVTGGSYEIKAGDHGMSGKDSVRIAKGSLVIEAAEDGIHSENNDDSTLGFVYIADGELTINAGDDGIHAGNQVLIENGSVNITECEEGIEGLTVDLAGGDITVCARDDGLNATDGSSSETMGGMPGNPFAASEGVYIKISGGTIYISAGGDGIDSNGDLYVTGGEIYVSGSENGGNGALDYAGAGVITGGSLIATGNSSMAQNFGNTSTQCAMLVSLSGNQSAGTELLLTDGTGGQIAGYTPERGYNCVVISCPDIKVGGKYQLQAGTETIAVEMTETIYGSSMMGGHGPGGFHGERPRFPFTDSNNGDFPVKPEEEAAGPQKTEQ